MTKVEQAFRHVQKHFPEITHVFYSAQGRWFYCDDCFDAPNFGKTNIDISLLEDAADEVTTACGFYFGEAE